MCVILYTVIGRGAVGFEVVKVMECIAEVLPAVEADAPLAVGAVSAEL